MTIQNGFVQDEEVPQQQDEEPQSSDLEEAVPLSGRSDDDNDVDEDMPLAGIDVDLKHAGQAQSNGEQGGVIGLTPSGGSKRPLPRPRGYVGQSLCVSPE